MKEDKYIYKNGDINFILCFYCRYKYGDKKGCIAFNDVIPDDILAGEFDHTKRHSDQKNDIIFEPTEEEKK